MLRLWPAQLEIVASFLLLASMVPSSFGQSPSRLGSSQELRDITGIENVHKQPAYSWWPYAIVFGLLFSTGMFLAGWRYWRRRFGEKELAPGIWALKELEHIDSMNLPDTGQVQKYLNLCSQVIRQYLEKRFQVRASRQTTPEFLIGLAHSSLLDTPQQNLLKEFFERCDLAKFARIIFPKVECQALGESARLFVQETATDFDA